MRRKLRDIKNRIIALINKVDAFEEYNRVELYVGLSEMVYGIDKAERALTAGIRAMFQTWGTAFARKEVA